MRELNANRHVLVNISNTSAFSIYEQGAGRSENCEGRRIEENGSRGQNIPFCTTKERRMGAKLPKSSSSWYSSKSKRCDKSVWVAEVRATGVDQK